MQVFNWFLILFGLLFLGSMLTITTFLVGKWRRVGNDRDTIVVLLPPDNIR